MAQAAEPYTTFFSRNNLRHHVVAGDAMSPTMCEDDVVLVTPADDFDGEGVYLVGLDRPRFYRVASCIGVEALDLISDNSRYHRERVTLDWFRDNVIGSAAFKLCALTREARDFVRSS